MIRNRRIVGLMVVALLVIAVRMVNAPVSYSQGGRLARCRVGHPARACRPSCGVGYTVGVTNLKGNK